MSLSLAKATDRILKIEDPSQLEVDILCDLFIATAKALEPIHRQLGRIYYKLEERVGKCAFGPGERYKPSARKMLMSKGASRGVVQSAMYGARAWALVIAGKLTEAEWEKLTNAECVALAHSQNYAPRPELRRTLAPHVGEPVSALVTRVTGMTRSVPVTAIPVTEKPQDREEAEKSVAALTVALAEAQRALLVARTHLARRMPGEWDNLISNSLTPLGRLRFALQEWIEEHAEPENILELPSLVA